MPSPIGTPFAISQFGIRKREWGSTWQKADRLLARRVAKLLDFESFFHGSWWASSECGRQAGTQRSVDCHCRAVTIGRDPG